SPPHAVSRVAARRNDFTLERGSCLRACGKREMPRRGEWRMFGGTSSPLVIAGLDIASRVYPTCDKSYCATRAGPSCGAISIQAHCRAFLSEMASKVGLARLPH